MGKIAVVGSLNMDLVVNTDKIPAMGETVHGKGFMTTPGGKGANQAVAAARLGGKVYMAGCVGDDIFGDELIKNLRANGVDVQNVRVCEGAATGIAVITVKDGDNCIILSSGANFGLNEKDTARIEALVKDCRVVVVQLEIPMDIVLRTVETAKRHGVKVLLNPAPAVQLTDELLKNIDIIVPNESEAEILTGIKPDCSQNIKEIFGFFKV